MNNFIFENGTKTYFGKGCVKEYLSCLTKHYGPNVMFAYGGGSIQKNGIYDEVMESLNRAGKNIIRFPGIMANPTYEKVLEGAKLARENKVDLIIGVGGGSVMDCCKAVSMAAVYSGDIWADFFARPGIMDFEPLPVGVVVTVAGTGSEMNGGAVITNEELKIKTGRDYPKCNPKFALLDPVYTYSVPKKQMVSGGFDILSHIMEIYFSEPDEDNVSDDMAEALMKNVIRNLRAAIRNPQDYSARSNLMWDAAMAENRIIKLGKRMDFECHNMEHQLGAYTNCNHGEGLAALHPVYYRHIYKDGLAKFSRFATHVWGISNEGKTMKETALAGVEALAGFIREIGLPTSLREMGIDKADLKKIADSCGISAGSYRQLTHQEIFEIFKECY
ncbi:iron-containing alcohol dehydrogenase [Parablautia muri]|uniref:Iron-containing alcohol dehydrogenase n=1 Tax=Parablautia muri TaxID=2320879 RepID=A0A9X5GSR4_9FIRM|nr:iron-containing alcohol dehydrogenase [Parablautia muri]NBJ94313.1 iron-containing alcohol dehydrogenase [Parablautia muri]